MLLAINRLRKTTEIDRVWKRGRSFFLPVLQIKSLPNTLGIIRCAVVVGTKVSKRAVVRNKIRRRIREVMRLIMPKLTGSVDMIISTKKGAEKLTYAEIEKQLHETLTKMHLLVSEKK